MGFADRLARFRIGKGAFADTYGATFHEAAFIEDPGGNLASSVVSDRPGVHMPVLDLDMEVRLVESTTPGHHHLYIDAPMPWRTYKRLLRAMCRAGLIERDWYRLAKRRRMTAVRIDGGVIPDNVVLRTVPAYEAV